MCINRGVESATQAWRPKPTVGQHRRTKQGEPSLGNQGGTNPGISRPQSQSHYLYRPSGAVDPANFRGLHCPWNAGPDPPKSEAASHVTAHFHRPFTRLKILNPGIPVLGRISVVVVSQTPPVPTQVFTRWEPQDILYGILHLLSLVLRRIQDFFLRRGRHSQNQGGRVKLYKVRLRLIPTIGLTCLLSTLALVIDHGFVLAVNGFSTNQELALPLLAPIGPAPTAFIVRGLEPSVRVDAQGTVYVSSIRGVPTGVDLHRYYATVDGPPGAGGTYPFKYDGQPDNCGIFSASPGGCATNNLDPFGLGLGGGDVDIAVNYPTSGTPNLALVSLTLAPGVTGTHSTTRGDSFSAPNPVVALIPGDDRQWIDGIDAQTVYLNYHDV